jgi:hypothetical protein
MSLKARGGAVVRREHYKVSETSAINVYDEQHDGKRPIVMNLHGAGVAPVSTGEFDEELAEDLFALYQKLQVTYSDKERIQFTTVKTKVFYDGLGNIPM